MAAAAAVAVRGVGAAMRAGAPAMATRVPRRHASAAFAHMKVKKNNWIEQNEVARENTFYDWTIGKHNLVGLLVMTCIFPAGYHYLHKSEAQLRDERMKGIKPARDLY